MEITEAVHTQIVFPGLIVSFVLVFAVLVFVFGFKSVEDFPFDKLATANDNRKPAGKKRKAKDKKSQPGQISSVAESKHKNVEGENKHVSNTSKSKNVEKTPAKEPLKANVRQDKKQSTVEQSVLAERSVSTALKETKNNRVVEKHIKTTHKDKENKEKSNKNATATKKQNKGKENINVQNKKNQDQSANKLDEKLNDDDGGEWEQAFSRKDKKIKKSPLIEEEPVDKLIKPDPPGVGKKKKVGHQTESANVPVESEPQVTPAPTPVPAAAPEPQVQEVTKVVAAKIKNKEQKKENQKSLKEVTNNKIVDSIKVEEEQSSKPKEKQTPKAHVESAKFIENEKESTADVISSDLKPTKETQSIELNPDAPIFDELGDSWKEAKAAKKQSKKKVRKAE